MQRIITPAPLQSRLVNWAIISITLTIAMIFVHILEPGINVSADSTGEGSNSSYSAYLPIINDGRTIYYVSPQGSDSNPGTLGLPWKTISKAARSVTQGDTIYIREGIYHEVVYVDQDGTINYPIRIKAYPGENPILDGYNQIPGIGTSLFNINGDWIELSGLEVQNSKYYGIGLYGKHDLVSNVFVHHCQKIGILINGDYGIVQDSRVWRNSMINEFGHLPPGENWSSGITSSDNYEGQGELAEYTIIRRNLVWENWGQGINVYYSNQVTIEDNISHDNYSTNIYIHDDTNIICQRNFVYMNPTSYLFGYGDNIGIMMGDEREFPSSNLTIINNISFNNNYNYALWKGNHVINNILIANNMFINASGSASVILKGYHQNVRFINNIVQQDGSLPLLEINEDPQVTFSNNLWSKNPPSKADGPGDIINDPLLSHTGDPYSTDWFKLTNSSPAINAATPLPEVVVDFFGILREATPDMGAIEFFPVP
jgi:hypothetical protein